MGVFEKVIILEECTRDWIVGGIGLLVTRLQQHWNTVVEGEMKKKRQTMAKKICYGMSAIKNTEHRKDVASSHWIKNLLVLSTSGFCQLWSNDSAHNI